MNKTGIEWTDLTWNPTTGCTKVSPGCKHCYAETVYARAYPKLLFTTMAFHPERLVQPLKIRAPKRIFVNSMSDLFHEKIPFDYVDRVFAAMALCPHHTFQVLTKRPERMREYVNYEFASRHVWKAADDFACRLNMSEYHPGEIYRLKGWRAAPWPLPNVWLGVSTENQELLESRWPILRDTPAAVRFLSIEPLLSRVDLYGAFGLWWNQTLDRVAAETDVIKPDWAIVGGESHRARSRARAFHIEWAEVIDKACGEAGVPIFVKQIGSNAFYCGQPWATVDAKGGDADEWPLAFRWRREFPKEAPHGVEG